MSFAQNLFYIALLQQPRAKRQPQWLVSRKAVVAFSGAYCACLIVAPVTAGTEWLIPQILLARAVLVSMQVFQWTSSSKLKDRGPGTTEVAAVDGAGVQLYLATLITVCGLMQAVLAFSEAPLVDVAQALFSHPAVSALGCDFMISSTSYLCWRSIGETDPSASSKDIE